MTPPNLIAIRFSEKDIQNWCPGLQSEVIHSTLPPPTACLDWVQA